MRERCFRHAVEHIFKFQQFNSKLLFQRLFDLQGGGFVPSPRAAQHALYARVGVLQIRRGVAFKRKHVFPIEDVIAVAVFAQIGVFHRADAHGATDLRGGVGRQFGVFLFYQCGGAFGGFVQQFHQFHGVARAGFERFAVFAHHRAKADKFGFHVFRQPACFARGGKKLLKMQRLARVHHIKNAVGVQIAHTVAHAGQIGGGV